MKTIPNKLRLFMNGLSLIIILCLLVPGLLHAQGFASVTNLDPVAAVKTTGDKPQSKLWKHNGKWYTVFPNSSGTFLWRLDNSTWSPELKLTSSTTVKADCKPVDNVCHILLWRKETTPSQLISVEFDSVANRYKLWSKRTSTVFITLDAGVEIATIDIDSRGRMWLASDGITDVRIRYSDSPYNSWSAPIILASGIKDDDICAVLTMPAHGKIGFFWSDQVTKRFGFRTHNDLDAPTIWTTNEVPASQSALNIKSGMADDHFNLKTDSNGSIYVAVKTGFDTNGYARIALLKRQPTGTWDNLYYVADYGTKPIVILNEELDKMKVVFSFGDHGGDILYSESSMSNPSFGAAQVIITGDTYNDPTNSKDNYIEETVILASTGLKIAGVLAKDQPAQIAPLPPQLIAPVDLLTVLDTTINLSWLPASKATDYHLQVSLNPDFSDLLHNVNSSDTFYTINHLEFYTTYYWRVEAINAYGNSAWSETRSFSTLSQSPDVPVLVSPANTDTDVYTQVVLLWNSSAVASAYHVQVADSVDFSNLMLDVNTLTDTLFLVDSLKNNNTYYWRVRASNAIGFSEWSASWSFTTVGEVSVPAVPELISPGNQAELLPVNPILVWSASSKATSYNIQISLVNDMSISFAEASGINTTSFQLDSLQRGTTYYWRVAAVNNSGISEWSSVWSFTTVQPVSNLVAYWKMDEGSGSLLIDQSGVGNNGVIPNGVLWVTGISGLALRLNGSAQYASVMDNESLDLTNALTIAGWIKPEKLASQYLVQKGLLVDGYQFHLLSTGKVSFQINQVSSQLFKLNSNTLYPYDGNTWMHIATTFDGAGIKLYINGTLDKSISFGTPVTAVTNNEGLVIGAKNDFKSAFKGAIDELYIYNTALTGVEIANLYTQTSTGRLASKQDTKSNAENSMMTESVDVRLYPNPVITELFIQMPEEDETAVAITIMETRGVVISNKKATVNNKSVRINLIDLASGTYFLKVRSHGVNKILRFIKE